MSAPMQEAPGLPAEMMPHPLPMAFNVNATPDGFVVVQIFDATGQRFVIFDKAAAKSFQEQFTRAVGSASSGLVIP